MPKRSRDKQLAKLAQRRQAERRAAKRRRDLTIGLVAGGIALILVAVGAFILFGGGDDQTDAASPSVSAEPGTQTARSPRRRSRLRRSPAAGRCRRRPTSPSHSSRAAAAHDRPLAHLHGHDRDLVRHDRGRAAGQDGDRRGQQLRVPGPAGLLRRPDLPPDRQADFVIQGGDPLGTGTGGPGYEFPGHHDGGASFDGPGVLAYANVADRQATGASSSSRWRPRPTSIPPRSVHDLRERHEGQDVLERSRPCPRRPRSVRRTERCRPRPCTSTR